MRVHRLEVTAFGPFADTQVVDFEPLNAAGVFLLTGPTGAGKTSVLDSICFALFGRVPGARDKAKTYHSHHAAPGSAPRVVLEVTLQGRRFRLARSPAWQRPSSRARSGFVEEKAKATAEELTGGAWLARSNRVDEVAHLVTSLLGLNCEQFCQVVLLPQGEFQAFLRADGRDRQRILESIFDTGRFEAVERWLAEHRRQQSRRCRTQEEQLSRLVARMQEVCPRDLASTHDCWASALDGRLCADVHDLVEAVAVEATRATELAERSASETKQAEHALSEADRLAERQDRYRNAKQQQAALAATADVVATRREAIRRARAAAPLLPLCRLASEAETTLADKRRWAAHSADSFANVAGSFAAAETSRATDDLTGEAAPVDRAEAASRRLTARVAELERLRVVEQECDTTAGRLEETQRAHAQLRVEVESLPTAIARTSQELALVRAELVGAREAADSEAGADARIEGAEATLAAARDVQQRESELERLRARRIDAQEATNAATASWLDARERCLAGLAAELAAQLSPGEACPVCGSCTHPAPADTGEQHVTRAQEEALFQRVTAARAALDDIEGDVAATERARADAAVRAGGLDVAQAAAVGQAARAVRDAAAAAGARCAELEVRADELTASLESADAAREGGLRELARLDERSGQLTESLDAKRLLLEGALGPEARADDVLAQTRSQLSACRALVDAVRDRDEAARVAAAAAARFHAALAVTEFVDAQQVQAAAMSDRDVANAESLNQAYDVAVATVAQVLSDETLTAAAACPAPDLAALASASELAATRASTDKALAADLEGRQLRLEQLLVELEHGIAALEPLREARQLADDVAGLCAGTSVDNPTHTALSRYVLGARLAQVVAAANVRLASVGGGRYRLEHTTDRTAGDRRGGLGLLVADAHTDLPRDPSTLSGGETFYVSLSLALGLADVVTNEAAGAELATLFVDEGFGALDDDTRDEVLDELDALRCGGRTVGLVSHLSELRSRFSTQLRIEATPGGSKCVGVAAAEAD